MKILIIGAGLIGKERIQACINLGYSDSIYVYDPYLSEGEVAKIMAQVNVLSDQPLYSDFNFVFVATPHIYAKEYVVGALDANCKVLIEKPMGVGLDEAVELCLHPNAKNLYVGFNYRFFLGVNQLLSDIKENKFGDIISVDMELGHGNSPGIEKTWKLDPKMCGGGCLIDPGVHLLDLINVIRSGDLEILAVSKWDGFWNTGIEEECHALFRDSNSTIYNFKVSLCSWRSTFLIHVNGTEGYGRVYGRGRSYGMQTYITGQRWGWMNCKSQSDSEIVVLETDCSNSFLIETAKFINADSNTYNTPFNNLADSESSLKVMTILNDMYMRLK